MCEQLERELHRSLTPEETSALRLAHEASPVPVLVERRPGDSAANPTVPRPPSD